MSSCLYYLSDIIFVCLWFHMVDHAGYIRFSALHHIICDWYQRYNKYSHCSCQHTFQPISLLSSVDLPAFGAPIIAAFSSRWPSSCCGRLLTNLSCCSASHSTVIKNRNFGIKNIRNTFYIAVTTIKKTEKNIVRQNYERHLTDQK